MKSEMEKVSVNVVDVLGLLQFNDCKEVRKFKDITKIYHNIDLICQLFSNKTFEETSSIILSLKEQLKQLGFDNLEFYYLNEFNHETLKMELFPRIKGTMALTEAQISNHNRSLELLAEDKEYNEYLRLKNKFSF